MEYIPEWFPGANFQRIASNNRRLAVDMRYLGYNAATEAHVSLNTSRSILSYSFRLFKLFVQENGHRDESLVSTILEEEGPSDTLRDAVGTLFAGWLSSFPLPMSRLTQ